MRTSPLQFTVTVYLCTAVYSKWLIAFFEHVLPCDSQYSSGTDGASISTATWFANLPQHP